MDRLMNYRQLIKRILCERAALANCCLSPGVETNCVLDEGSDQYLLLSTGWSQDRRVRGMTLYVRIKDSKIWIEEDWTENGITSELLEAGVPKEDIVLAFQHPDMRPYTEFAVA